ncbi:MAG: hypothetical protein GAK28_01263 [Luteibacter sp.]|uniref:MASE1 domain-containing protein n=1 Tax=Luteibacter sp. TaxID=1886636 RepID=UPI00137C6B08|nr:MASE1 domain-containing protein [Luteibacter sp.]KAF1008282.1 MAG: hypothetical protein GAK28_01263 [Luteibacter sp.]
MIDQHVDRTLLTPWWQHLCVMAAYVMTDQILSGMSYRTSVLTAGLRLSCLLLVSRRFWGAIIVGEILSIAVITIPCVSAFGTTWLTAVLIPPMLYCIPLVFFMQNHVSVFDQYGYIRPVPLLIATSLCALLSALRTDLTFLAVVMQDGSSFRGVSWNSTGQMTFGSYLGSLTITPFVLAVRERLLRRTQPLSWHELMKRSLFRDVLMFELPIVAGLFLAATFLIGGTNLAWFRALMIVPVVMLGLRHGWHGAAVGGMVASFFLTATALDHRDPSLFPTQATLALTISFWLLLAQRGTPKSLPPGSIPTSAWASLMSLVPVQSIRYALSPRYRGLDGTLYGADGRMIASAAG